MERIQSYRELRVYQAAFAAAMRIFEVTTRFPREERFSLTDQMRRSSRSVCEQVAEAWRHRVYPNAFTSKLTGASGEADETRVWLEFALHCGYISQEVFDELDGEYNGIIGQLVQMASHPQQWVIRRSK